jgi:hypothetical protein
MRTIEELSRNTEHAMTIQMAKVSRARPCAARTLCPPALSLTPFSIAAVYGRIAALPLDCLRLFLH